MGQNERRIHTRLQLSEEVRASTPKGFLTGYLRDVSKGGAGVVFEESVGDVGETIEIFLPFPGGVEIAVMAEIVRIQETQGGLLHGLCFSLVEPSMQEKLLTLVETLLAGSGGKRREHPRVSKRIPIRYGNQAEFQAGLQTISMGGLSMMIDTPVVLFQEVEVSIPDVSGRELLILPARVIYQHNLEKSGKKQYEVGLQFRELTGPQKACLAELLRYVMDTPADATGSK
ncbi:MAG TPA: PilZ domain-containing protein [Bdellovibrionota bacterium]|nr:PilZ domain-containing protein [Bdellovibrionota bacterium]